MTDINNIARCLCSPTFISDNRKPKDRVVIPTTAEALGEAVLLTGQGLSAQTCEGGLGLTRKEQPDPVPSFSWHGCPALIKHKGTVSTQPLPASPPAKQTSNESKTSGDGGNQRHTLIRPTETESI